MGFATRYLSNFTLKQFSSVSLIADSRLASYITRFVLAGRVDFD
jgi:hypothetical protein